MPNWNLIASQVEPQMSTVMRYNRALGIQVPPVERSGLYKPEADAAIAGGGKNVLISPRIVGDYRSWNDRFLANAILRSRATKNLLSAQPDLGYRPKTCEN